MGAHRKKLTKLLIGIIIGNSVPLTLALISFAWFYSNTSIVVMDILVMELNNILMRLLLHCISIT